MAKASVAHRVRAITPDLKTVCNKHHKWKDISKVKNDRESEEMGWLICKVENSQWIKGNVWKQLGVEGFIISKGFRVKNKQIKGWQYLQKEPILNKPCNNPSSVLPRVGQAKDPVALDRAHICISSPMGSRSPALSGPNFSPDRASPAKKPHPEG